ncbi:GNAT family N-acetyltransferase [Arthrobacter sunyaminii]|uniref:GNAT family N-acetyltransferase n=1 Tax=Arthrobacter sunyaminii TaxID=2816859 RepID=UPI001A93E0C3|nr:GNAT family protein [Arthrobacter sunyaminii]MBO0895826.1 GNAT family N-acetyltransferase [Arthrobacter sunyaminii]
MTIELRPWILGDAPTLCTVYQEDTDLHVQFGGANLSTLELARHHISEQLPFSESFCNWAISVDGVAVGNVGLSAIDRCHRTAWVFYWLASAARGNGYASRALATVADKASEDGLFRLELGHRVNNPASCTVATRAGFIIEGLERQKLQYGTERFDVETHARLQTDPRPETEPIPTAR